MSCSSQVPYKEWRLQVLSKLFLPQSQVPSCRLNARRYLSSSKTLHNVRTYSTNRDNDANNQDDSTPRNISNTTLSQKPRPSDSLPKSPLFKLSQTRPTGHRPRKPQGTKADDARLRNNPWAVALASPIRNCTATSMRVPKAFLTEMGLVRQIDEAIEGKPPKTNVWWMPTGLLKRKLSKNITPEKSSNNRKLPIYLPLAVRKDTDRKVKAFQFVPSEWRTRFNKSEYAEINNVEWPEGLPDLVLKYLGEKVVRDLKEAYRYERIKGEKADQWRVLQVPHLSVPSLIEGLRHIEIKDIRAGAVVIMGDPEPESTRDAFASRFPDYLTLPQTQSTVPVIDLSTLLSASDRQALRESIPRFAEKALFFRADGPKSVDAMLAMWELKGYVMHDAEYVPDLRAQKIVDKE
ncbi:conserved hypothetical protein [Talaromyces marneffei ATCC 18224]|uniref:Uncharacterized protein n=1 Tax=Talaromyces marneffei (strain ATCC 18224 / CBS 334.59 / QM 7333) TaxID=441960 RepID=B6QVS0_TALMQ|nr:conserved hypothetical protein [Talaromyces marneffei ATCC 18224]